MTSYLPNLSTDNLSFYTIPAAFVIALLPRLYAAGAYKTATGKSFPKKEPRGFANAVAKDQACDGKTKGRICRAEAAVANNFENLAFFACAVTAGSAARLSPATLNACSIGYVVSRFVYNHIYIFNDLMPSQARTAAWFAGVSCCFTLFIQAGRSFNKAALL